MSKIVIEKLVPGGQGLATLPDGKKAFFWNALPGEEVVEYEVTRSKTHYVEGVALSVAQPSAQRVEPRDACYLSTSPWQVMRYEYELEQKLVLLEESFSQVGLGDVYGVVAGLGGGSAEPERRDPATAGVANASPNGTTSIATDNKDFFYRNKMEYALYYSHEDEQIHLAFHQRGSHRKVPVEQSSLERPEIWQKAQEIVAELNARGEEARKYQSLLLRCNQAGEVSGGLYENGQPHPVFSPLKDTILGREYTYSPNGFFQINLPVYEMVLQEIAQQIETEEVLDLYAGVGTIGLSVAREKRLTLVECDGAAYKELERNCREVRNSNISAVLSKSEEVLEYIQLEQTVIVDPPRAGCDGKLIDKLLEVRPAKIIYLSCNPATQARDVARLGEKYQITLVQPYNFFPRTPHLENLVILERK